MFFSDGSWPWLLSESGDMVAVGGHSNLGNLGEGFVSKVRRSCRGSETYHGTLTDGKLVWDDGAVWVRVGISDEGGMQVEDNEQRRVSKSDFVQITG